MSVSVWVCALHLHEVYNYSTQTYPDSDDSECNSHGKKYDTNDNEANADMSGGEHRTTGWNLLLKPFIT